MTICVLLFWIAFLELSFEGYYRARDMMLIAFLVYYVLHFLYMLCFIDESFDLESRKWKDPVNRKIEEVKERRVRSRLVLQV